MNPDEKFYSVKQVAEILGVHADTVRELIHSRRVASIKVGRHFRIRSSALEAYVARFERRAIEPGAYKQIRRRVL